jgi:aspartate aminotransferase-like enzyme
MLKQTPPYFAHAEFGALLESLKEPLRDIFRTENPVLIGTGSGTLAMETVINNFFQEGDSVIVIKAGKYGDHWETICEQYHGIDVTTINVYADDEWPEYLDNLRNLLQSGDSYQGVFMTHCETTTAMKMPIHEINMIVKTNQPACLTVVDAVSSLGVEYIRSQDYDVVISSSQKGLQCPPGLFFITFGMYAYNTADRLDRKSFYFDIIKEIERYHKNQTSHTPAANLFAPLRHALHEIEKMGGIDNLEAHCHQLMLITHGLLDEYEIPIHNSCGVCTAIQTNKQNQIQELLEKKEWYVGGGVRQNAGEMIRLMHFGWATEPKFIELGVSAFIDAYRKAGKE